MKYKILAIIANHTNSKIKYNISLNNISFIKNFVTNIVIIDSENELFASCLKEDLKDTNIISNHYFVKNDHYFDFGKWNFAIEKINKKKYDYILFLNDSIILTKEIEKYFIYIETVMATELNLYAYNDSTQITYHYQSYLFLIKNTILDKFYDFFQDRKHLVKDLESLVRNVELQMCEIDSNHDVFLKIGKEYSFEKNLYWENEDLYKYLLNKNIFALIKLKKIFDIQRDYKITLYGQSIDNFDINFYKDYYDFQNMTDREAFDHFINYGQYEGRKPTKEFNTILPKYYREKLDELGILYFFDVPNDFDIYYYKKNNPDIDTLSILDSIFHYVNYGFLEERKYNKDSNKNDYLNDYYINILFKLQEIKVNNLPESFSLNTIILLNDLYNKNYYLGCLKEYLTKKDIIFDRNILLNILSKLDYNKYKRINNLEDVNTSEIIKHYIANNKNSRIYKLPHDFNGNIYKKIYKDLSNYNKQELEEHYMIYGIKENRIYKLPDDFNTSIYKEIHSDLTKLSDDQLKEHYLFKGVIEKRSYKIPKDFNPSIYKKIYKDLSELNDLELRQHYAKYGVKDNRIYKLPNDFKTNIYKKIYNDLANFSNEELIEHYLTKGFLEGRIYQLPNDFNCELYKKIYPDLSHMNNKSLEEHYLYLGHIEKRLYKLPDDFNPSFFKKLNKELSYLSDENIKEHYLLHGIRDNLKYKLPDGFDWKIYRKIYRDLSNLNEEELINHFIDFGYKEGRSYKVPNDFNPKIYKKIYRDLRDLTEEQLIDHYIEHGIIEKRLYKVPDDFDCDLFRKIYPELSNLNDVKLKEYYLENGIWENKIYKIPSDFIPEIYKKIYKDISSITDDECIKHYIQYGLKEERIYKLPDDFQPKLYKTIYSDLKTLNDEELRSHYLYYGVNEKRIYKLPNDFNLKIYKNMYDDLKNLNDVEIKNHYLTKGFHENRKYK